MERPQACQPAALPQQLFSPTAQHAVQVAVQAYHQVNQAATKGAGCSMFPADPLRIAASLGLVEFDGDHSALLLSTPVGGPDLLLPPESYAGFQAEQPDYECHSVKPCQSEEQAAGVAAQLIMAQMLASVSESRAPHSPKVGSRDEVREVYLVWAESLGGIRVSPSLLLAFMLLSARQESAMFLRMATGFGFAQIGDYTASLFYLFRRRGHRLKCWECGVKKKAPCGKIDRDDLPWCCHRRLGEWLPKILAEPCADGGLLLHGQGKCFLSLLPPREALDSEDPIRGQLCYSPRAADVVCLSDVLMERPVHPRQTLRKALYRLAPTCRVLWSNTRWIVDTIAKVKLGDVQSGMEAHLWLEKTAFFKVPRALQDETAELLRRPFEELVQELLPDVGDAPVLGGHNRQPRPASQQALVQAEARNGQGAAYRAPVTRFTAARVASGEEFCEEGRERPIDPRVQALGGRQGSEESIYWSGDNAVSESGTDTGSAQGDRQWSNTGQGRRRLNARAALRAAGHTEFVGDRQPGSRRKRKQRHGSAAAASDGLPPRVPRLPPISRLMISYSADAPSEARAGSPLSSAQESPTSAQAPQQNPVGAYGGGSSPVWRSRPFDNVARRILQPSGSCHVSIVLPHPIKAEPCRSNASPPEREADLGRLKSSHPFCSTPRKGATYECSPGPLSAEPGTLPLQPILQQNIQAGRGESPAACQQKTTWRKPRTARLRFWTQPACRTPNKATARHLCMTGAGWCSEDTWQQQIEAVEEAVTLPESPPSSSGRPFRRQASASARKRGHYESSQDEGNEDQEGGHASSEASKAPLEDEDWDQAPAKRPRVLRARSPARMDSAAMERLLEAVEQAVQDSLY